MLPRLSSSAIFVSSSSSSGPNKADIILLKNPCFFLFSFASFKSFNSSILPRRSNSSWTSLSSSSECSNSSPFSSAFSKSPISDKSASPDNISIRLMASSSSERSGSSSSDSVFDASGISAAESSSGVSKKPSVSSSPEASSSGVFDVSGCSSSPESPTFFRTASMISFTSSIISDAADPSVAISVVPDEIDSEAFSTSDVLSSLTSISA